MRYFVRNPISIIIGWEDLQIAGKLRGENDHNNAILS
jgi:hypothetical protein